MPLSGAETTVLHDLRPTRPSRSGQSAPGDRRKPNSGRGEPVHLLSQAHQPEGRFGPCNRPDGTKLRICVRPRGWMHIEARHQVPLALHPGQGQEPTAEKVHGTSEEVVGELSPFVLTGSGPGSLCRLVRGDARGREKKRRIHRSLRRKVKSKLGTELSSPPGEGTMGTDDGEDSETSIETSSWMPSAASSSERSRSAFSATERRGSACKSRTSTPFKTRIISLYNRGEGAGTEADTTLEISGLRHRSSIGSSPLIWRRPLANISGGHWAGLLPLWPQANVGAGIRKNGPKAAAPPSSQGKKGAVSQKGPPAHEAKAGLMMEVLRKDVKIDRSFKMADLRVRGSFTEAAMQGTSGRAPGDREACGSVFPWFPLGKSQSVKNFTCSGCYQCGVPGHNSRTCRASPNCPLCSDLGRPVGHCLSALKCAQDRREESERQQKGRKNTSPPVAPTSFRDNGADNPLNTGEPAEEAQGMLLQSLAKSGYSLEVGTEPHSVPSNHPSWGAIVVVGTYLNTVGNLTQYKDWLSEVESCVGWLSPSPVLLRGDFNAWSTACGLGSRTSNRRDATLERWAAALGLVLLN
ncbi:hypothetical protein KM043_018569 [Ampulex compressa]|nr:hypothetical protein KM043_018569 [Ampulex compressa]